MLVNSIPINIDTKRINRPPLAMQAGIKPEKQQPIKPQEPQIEKNRHVKVGVLATTILGMVTALAVISKKQRFSLNPKKIMNTKVKNWAIFKIPKKKNDVSKTLDFKEGEILGMAGASVIGGLTGGALFDDKKNLKAKLRESVNQMLGDVMVPLAFVAGPTRLYKKFEKLSKKETKQLKLQKISKYITGNKFLKIFCPVAVSGVSLGAGILAGNKVSNYLNEKVQKVKVERKIKLTDFAPHLDDICLAITLMAEKSPLESIISKFIPFALLVPGLETGNAKEKS